MSTQEPAKTVSAELLLGGVPHTGDQLQDAISDQLRLVELTYKTGDRDGARMAFGVVRDLHQLRTPEDVMRRETAMGVAHVCGDKPALAGQSAS